MQWKKMISQILEISHPDFLFIDFLNHDFAAINALKYCKEKLNSIEDKLCRFTKIAFLIVPPYKSGHQYLEKLQQFYSEKSAIDWMLTVH